MHELIRLSIEAHGGLERWRKVRQVCATFVPGGMGLVQRGQEGFTTMPTRVIVDTQTQKTTFEPFLRSDQRGVFEPLRTVVESTEGDVLEQLDAPRHSFRLAEATAHWSATQLVYFAGCAMWTYLTLPFSLAMPGIQCDEVEPHQEDGESWRALRVVFPASFVTHSTEQTLYFDDKGLIRRHDYSVDISNGAQAAHYLYDHRTFDGIVFPTRRRICPRGPDLKPRKEVVVFSAELGAFALTGFEADRETDR